MKPLLKTITQITLGGIFLIGILSIIGVWRTGGQFWQNAVQLFVPVVPPPEVDVRSVMIHKVRSASELTTAIFAMEAVVPTQQDRNLLGQFTIGTTTLLYIAYGEVRAGVDLSQLEIEDVDIQDDQIVMSLPAPQILDSKIDVDRSEVYDYTRGFLGLGPDSAPQLQTLASQAALDKIIVVACSQDILGQANERAEFVVTQLLSTTTEKSIVVKTHSPDSEQCSK